MADPDNVSLSAKAQQWEVGRQARKRVPRSGLGAWVAQVDRPDPVGLLQVQEVGRVPDRSTAQRTTACPTRRRALLDPSRRRSRLPCRDRTGRPGLG